MADQATNVIDAGKVIAGLMTSQPEPQTTEEPVEAEAAPVEESQDEDTVNPSDVPYMEQELEEAPAEEAVAEEEATQDINENSEEPSYTVKVDGSEMEVTLDELLRGYQREADYTRKTSELSLEKSRHNDMMQQSQSEINQKLSKLTELTSAAQQELQTEYSNIDFEKLYEDDPVEAARLEHKMRKRSENLQRIQEETRNNQMNEFQKYLQEEQAKVATLIPEFSDPAKASRIKSEMRTYLTKLGYNNNEIASVYDSRQVMLIKDAMAYDKLKKSNVKVTKKVAKAPKVVKPGVPKTKAEQASKQRRDKLNHLKKTGSVRSAAKVFRDYL
jgi:hypothetical protein|tara:strand:+ start:1035 stop:2024 length:990 start_codon:yes stop_codon:yes gene_type:complete